MRPLIADGGSLTVLRRLASFAWGEWRVEWPESVPDEQRPKIDDDREFGYVYDMPRQVGRMGRRFVRSDVSITAADYGPDGVALPFSGFSDVEQALDEAAGRTDGDTFFEREIDRGGLNGLVPFEDFGVGDSVDVGVWSVVLPSQVVVEVQEVTELGVGVVDWRVRVSGDLVPDDVGRKRQNLELERQVWQERRERIRSVDAERSARTTEIATERRARVSGDKSLSDRIDRLPTSEVLNAEIEGLNSKIGGLNTDLTLLKQGEINEIQRVINDKQTGINALNTRFQQEQLKVNALNDDFRTEQQKINRFQGDLSQTNKAAVDALTNTVKLQSLLNYGSWYISESFNLKRKEIYTLKWDKQRSKSVSGCSLGTFTDSGGAFVNILEPGDWQFYAKVMMPPSNILVPAEFFLGIFLCDDSGKVIDSSITRTSNNGFYHTMQATLTTFVPEKFCYARVTVSASEATSGSLFPSGSGAAYTEFSARQLSRLTPNP